MIFHPNRVDLLKELSLYKAFTSGLNWSDFGKGDL